MGRLHRGFLPARNVLRSFPETYHTQPGVATLFWTRCDSGILYLECPIFREIAIPLVGNQSGTVPDFERGQSAAMPAATPARIEWRFAARFPQARRRNGDVCQAWRDERLPRWNVARMAPDRPRVSRRR
jgi:hypothetical protein